MVSLFGRNFNLKVSLIFILSALAVFFCARIALLLMYSTNFEALTTWQIIKAFLNGFRFDYYIVALFLMPCAFMMNLPVKSRLWFKIWLFTGFLVLLSITLILIGDIVYFPEVNRHIAQEIVTIQHDMGFIVSYAFEEYWFILLPLFSLLFFAFWFFNKQINKFWQKPEFSFKKLAKICLIFIVLIFLGIRGHFGGGKPLGIADVYKYAKTTNDASLVLNGAFSAYHVLRKGKVSSENNYPYDKALEEVQTLFKENGSNFEDTDYPLEQFPQSKEKVKDINFMIVMLESWNKPNIGAYNPTGDTHTPYFDKMAKNGVLFTNAYAAGQRSIFGFTSILAGLPLINGLPMFGYGLEQNSINSVPAHFAEQGFDTFFIRSANCDSFRMCTLARLLGVQNNHGAEDLPHVLTYKGNAKFGYDYEMLVFAADKIKERKNKNFFAMLFTATTHEPFVDLTEEFNIYKDGSWYSKYRNSLAYADDAINVLIERAKKDGWFDNTVFIFVSDHTGRSVEHKIMRDYFSIPLLIYAPKILKPQVIDYPVSQLDIVPTIYKIASLNTPRTLFGTDLLNKNATHFAMLNMGTNTGIVTKDGAILYDGNKIIEEEKFTSDFDPNKNLNLLLALDKVGKTLLQSNRWYKEVKSEK